ncbi:hypothetical protein SAMN05878482_105256 [Peribacillus simplex]|uniref:Uncharacterized protein n=1 Tax=Peribacillus simplex TaxID=1478 RepID=A0A9X8RBA9_9BACI|nr:hypothetical protein SAMN05878482_105256 [Peribacillus simplex]
MSALICILLYLQLQTRSVIVALKQCGIKLIQEILITEQKWKEHVLKKDWSKHALNHIQLNDTVIKKFNHFPYFLQDQPANGLSKSFSKISFSVWSTFLVHAQ